MTRIILSGAVLTTGLALSLPATAANLTRTFVSATGSDANPCTITQPCATFAHAYSLTAANGIIAALDPGKYGPLTITGPVTVNGNGWAAITAPASGNGITINAGGSDAVELSGLELDGAGAGYNGIVANSFGNLTVADCVLQNFVRNGSDITTGNGILIQPASGTLNFVISNTTVANNEQGGVYYLAPSGSPIVNSVIDHVVAFADGEFGINLDATSANGGSVVATISNSFVSKGFVGIGAGGGAASVKVSIDNVTVIGADYAGIYAHNPSTVLLGRSVITGNAYGIQNYASTFYTYKDNRINLNPVDLYGTSLNTAFTVQ